MRPIADRDSTAYNSLFAPETTKSEQDRIFRLVTIDIPSGSTLRVVDNNENVVYGAVTYNKFPIKFSEISVTNDGTINKASLLVANPSRVFQADLENYNGLRGAKVSVKAVFSKFLDSGTSPDPTAYVEDFFIIDSYSANETTITFQLDPIADLEIQVPRRRFSATSCYFRLGDPDTCGYSGPLTSCKKTLEDCKVHYTFTYSTGSASMALGASTVTFSGGTDLITAGATVGDTIQFSPTVSFRITSVTNSTTLVTSEVSTTNFVNTNYTIYRGNQRRFGGFPGINSGARRITI